MYTIYIFILIVTITVITKTGASIVCQEIYNPMWRHTVLMDTQWRQNDSADESCCTIPENSIRYYFPISKSTERHKVLKNIGDNVSYLIIRTPQKQKQNGLNFFSRLQEP